jgi:hypothetical protein
MSHLHPEAPSGFDHDGRRSVARRPCKFEGLIELKGDRLNIPDWDRLKEVGEFNPTYLHLESDQAAA